MTVHEFEVLGCKVFTHLGQERLSNFRLVAQLFELNCTALEELNAFLILEELAILIEEMDNDEQAIKLLNQIFHAFNMQVYSEFRAVAYLVA